MQNSTELIAENSFWGGHAVSERRHYTEGRINIRNKTKRKQAAQTAQKPKRVRILVVRGGKVWILEADQKPGLSVKETALLMRSTLD